jgi:antitoxin (DNA-binding transcriptional repressor) of toxin-antitoxin stability system
MLYELTLALRRGTSLSYTAGGYGGRKAMTRVTIDIAQKELPNLIEDVVLGGHVVITKNQKPVAEIVPVPNDRPAPQFGSAKGMISIRDDFDAPLEDLGGYSP